MEKRTKLTLAAWAALKGATWPVFSTLGDRMVAFEATPAQIGLLHGLVLDKEMATPVMISRCLDVTPPTVTATLNKLEQAGLVERARDAKDRRVVNVCVTPKGHELVRAWRAAFVDCLEQLMAPLTDDELRTVTRILAKLGPPIYGPPGGFGALISKDGAPAPFEAPPRALARPAATRRR